MGTCALVGAVDFNVGHFRSQRPDYVIAVDRGYAQLKAAGIEPDAVVGDFDSLGFVPDASNVAVFPAEKDESDMELACRKGLAHADELLLYGCLSARLDHTIANVQLMSGLAQAGVRVFGIGDAFALAAIAGGAAPSELRFAEIPPEELIGPYANFVSVFAHGGTARDVCEKGLKYAFEHEDVPDTVSRGLSNEFAASPASITVGAGTLLITFPLEAWGALL